MDYVFEESTGTLTLTGTGATPDYTPESLPPFAAHRSQIRTVQVEEGITGLGDNLLRQLTAATDVQLPESLRTIGSNTFSMSQPYSRYEFLPGSRVLAVMPLPLALR